MPTESISATAHEATLNRIVDVIEAAGMRIFARIDHGVGARDAGPVTRPSVVLIDGQSRRGTPIRPTPAAAPGTPLTVPAREGDDGQTRVSFHPIARLLAEARVDGELALLDPAQQKLLTASGR